MQGKLWAAGMGTTWDLQLGSGDSEGVLREFYILHFHLVLSLHSNCSFPPKLIHYMMSPSCFKDNDGSIDQFLALRLIINQYLDKHNPRIDHYLTTRQTWIFDNYPQNWQLTYHQATPNWPLIRPSSTLKHELTLKIWSFTTYTLKMIATNYRCKFNHEKQSLTESLTIWALTLKTSYSGQCSRIDGPRFIRAFCGPPRRGSCRGHLTNCWSIFGPWWRD